MTTETILCSFCEVSQEGYILAALFCYCIHTEHATRPPKAPILTTWHGKLSYRARKFHHKTATTLALMSRRSPTSICILPSTLTKTILRRCFNTSKEERERTKETPACKVKQNKRFERTSNKSQTSVSRIFCLPLMDYIPYGRWKRLPHPRRQRFGNGI